MLDHLEVKVKDLATDRQGETPEVFMNLEGGCSCAAVRYKLTANPLIVHACHCRDCQRQSGAPHVAAVRMPAATFRIVQGSPKRYIAKADSGNDITRVFCGACGTPLYVQVSTRPDIVGVRVCTFDDASWFRPEANIFVKSAQPWDHMDPAVPTFATYPTGKAY